MAKMEPKEKPSNTSDLRETLMAWQCRKPGQDEMQTGGRLSGRPQTKAVRRTSS